MAKRFTDTDIWDQDWFVALPNKYKLLWNYMKDKCDDCGVWRPNKEILQRIISEPLNLNEFLVFTNTEEKERILVLKNGRWFLKDYFFFQYGDKFNPHSPVHRGVLKRLVSHGIHLKELSKVFTGKLEYVDSHILRQVAYDYPKDTLEETYGYPINRVKDKDKDKEYKKGGKGGNLKGVRFSDDGTVVYFSDDSFQTLGQQQLESANKNDFSKPYEIVKGSIY